MHARVGGTLSGIIFYLSKLEQKYVFSLPLQSADIIENSESFSRIRNQAGGGRHPLAVGCTGNENEAKVIKTREKEGKGGTDGRSDRRLTARMA